MGGEVIIITQDPDARAPGEFPPPTPKVEVTSVQLNFSDYASPDDVAGAVKKVLDTALSVRDGG